ncbi:hypothetical protein MMC16_003511 [Acarospora aff. strigata]|nr:hypothetical protein [Acarospora aff. strigata]
MQPAHTERKVSTLDRTGTKDFAPVEQSTLATQLRPPFMGPSTSTTGAPNINTSGPPKAGPSPSHEPNQGQHGLPVPQTEDSAPSLDPGRTIASETSSPMPTSAPQAPSTLDSSKPPTGEHLITSAGDTALAQPQLSRKLGSKQAQETRPAQNQNQNSPTPTQAAPDQTSITQIRPPPAPLEQSDHRVTSTGEWVPAITIQSQTIEQGAPGGLISGITVQYSAGSIYVGNNVAPISAPLTSSPPQRQPTALAVVGGLSFWPVQQPGRENTSPLAVVVSDQTLSNNGPAITMNGEPVQYSSGSIQVGTNIAPAPTFASQPKLDDPAPQVVGGFTMTPILVSDHPASITPITVAGQAVSYDSLGAKVGTTRILPGAAPVTISGTPVSLGSEGLMVGGQTFSALAWSAVYGIASKLQTIGGETVIVGPSGAVAIGSTTLTVGASPITVSGTPVSLGVAALVVGSSTIPLAPAPKQSFVFTVAGTPFTAHPTGFSIAGHPSQKAGLQSPSPAPLSLSVPLLSSSVLGPFLCINLPRQLRRQSVIRFYTALVPSAQARCRHRH